MCRFSWLLLACVAAGSIGLLGCDRGEEPPIEPAPEGLEQPDPGAQAPQAPADEPEGPEVVTDTYELRAHSEVTYAVSQLSQMAVEITGRDPWHVNEDFPTRVEVQAPDGVALPEASFGKADAAEFGEERVRFDIPFTPEAEGEHRLTADVAFAICSEDTCIPQRKTLAVTLRAE